MTAPTAAEIARAAAILRSGGLVAFPTETVYGLGADARNPDAVARIFSVKGRPQNHPVIVHIASVDGLPNWAREVPPFARALAAAFWPGPLTLILPRAAGVPDAVTGGQDTVGIRIPSHPVALALLHAFAGVAASGGHAFDGIAAPSANKFGRISPTTAVHVQADLDGEVELILDGGACDVGIESTIIDCSRGRPVLLRPGRITAADVARVTGSGIGNVTGGLAAGDDREAPRASGTLESHYAPRHALELIEAAQWHPRVTRESRRRAVLAFSAQPAGDHSVQWLHASSDLVAYGHDLYANLRALDASACDVILVEAPPDDPAWEGVRDRLKRAAAPA